MKALEEVLAAWRADAKVACSFGSTNTAKVINMLADDVAAATGDYRAFISEADAHLRDGKSEAWHRARYPEWANQGHAKKVNGSRFYRTIVLPQRAVPAAFEEGRQAGQEKAVA